MAASSFSDHTEASRCLSELSIINPISHESTWCFVSGFRSSPDRRRQTVMTQMAKAAGISRNPHRGRRRSCLVSWIEPRKTRDQDAHEEYAGKLFHDHE